MRGQFGPNGGYLDRFDDERARVSGGCEGREETAKSAARGTGMCRAGKPDLAILGYRRGGLTAVAEGCLALRALDERDNAGVVFCGHSLFSIHRYDAYRII